MIELHNQVRAPRLETANQRHGAFHRFKPCPIAAPFGSLATSAPAICRCQRRERTLPLPYRSVPLSQSSSLRWNCPESRRVSCLQILRQNGSKDAVRAGHTTRCRRARCRTPSRATDLPVRRSMPGSSAIAYNGLLSFAALLL